MQGPGEKARGSLTDPHKHNLGMRTLGAHANRHESNDFDLTSWTLSLISNDILTCPPCDGLGKHALGLGSNDHDDGPSSNGNEDT
jgi:hypothetical protein